MNEILFFSPEHECAYYTALVASEPLDARARAYHYLMTITPALRADSDVLSHDEQGILYFAAALCESGHFDIPNLLNNEYAKYLCQAWELRYPAYF